VETLGAPGPSYDAVIFDLDGVLTETEHLWAEARAAYAGRHAYAWRPEDTDAVMGMSTPEWARYMAELIGGGDGPEAVAEAVVDGMIGALAAGRVELLPGAREVVAAAGARVPLALASSAARLVIDGVLDATGLRPYFAATVSSEEVARGKPAPDVYFEAARRLGVSPNRCLAVEDSSNGIRAAAAAGLTVIAIPNPTFPPSSDALALAAATVGSLREVQTELLARLGEPPGKGPRQSGCGAMPAGV
jgi:HAD superfamily hydrolase (TIGR01509 family)